MGREKNIEEINEAREKINDRLSAIYDKALRLVAEIERVDADEDRIVEALEGASSEEKEALLFEARELSRKREDLMEELRSPLEEAEGLQEETSALSERSGPALEALREALRTASLETEKMFFEVFKLVATLAVGSIVAISAVTPALFPRLGNLEGLWPAYGWLLFSLASSVVTCGILAFSIGMTLNPIRPRRTGWLRRKIPERVSRLISSIVYALLLGLPLASLLNGLWKFTLFVSKGLG